MGREYSKSDQGSRGGSGGGSGGYHTKRRFPERAGPDWPGPLIDYKELDLLRKFLTSSSKLMSRKRAGTNTQEQAELKRAVKRARFMALVPYCGM